MPRVGFEPMIPVFEQMKTVHALDRMATVISPFEVTACNSLTHFNITYHSG
jgi:hypothetical protein